MNFDEQRVQMVEQQLRARGLRDERMLAAFRRVPRHLFVPEMVQVQAYEDCPLPIGEGQTISQPYMVALMTSSLCLQGHERVLEIGTGCGYQTAILAEMALEVYSVERLAILSGKGREMLERLGYLNVHLSAGDGSLGWPDHEPYDAILVSASTPRIPPPLLEQLADPGRMVLPIGPRNSQTLVEVDRRNRVVRQKEITRCVFVPLLGQYGWPEDISNPT